MMVYPWYSRAEDGTLAQGDLLFSFPLFVPNALTPEDVASKPTSISGRGDVHNVVILSQSCDLLRGKVPNVLICPVFEFRQGLRATGNR